ncbi:hypothetical protein PFICI_01338 [Pestalotiopsis fici W106-1]|uniref:REJ domain-containing protein n=1 Tax=Pestalotiopsis fici (strain W106-1 / CGMCC3.15140) TaxID=1229662 RepID=W3XNI2_PESFW|nr:uncharacterized protein PFICI_01338 [Pestalotiopsis fici W106-1]ETS87510.1 hypothetical protein PFICI_01338 [Pestalotiopsis fici W106-1]
MKSTCFSIVLATIGARLTLANNYPRQNNGTEGLRRLPGAQGVAVDGSNGAASPGLKPIPGSAVQVESLQPLIPLSSTGLVNTGAAGQSISVTLTSAEGAGAATLISSVVLTSASVSSSRL